MLFQTLIKPIAMLDVIAKFRGNDEYSRAMAGKYVGNFGGSTASDVAGVHFHNTLAEFPPEERDRLKVALQMRIRVVLNAVLTDLGLANSLKIDQ